MRITPVPFELHETHVGDPRSEGAHLSEITRDIGKQLGYIPPDTNDGEMNWTRIHLGTAWENFIFPTHHPEVLHQPGELTHHGIHMTSDGLSWLDEETRRVHECKLTWKSMAKERDLEGQWLWLAQTKFYCHGWGTRFARYHIYWVNGNYKWGTPDGQPSYRLYDLEFTRRELDENMRMILKRGITKFGITAPKGVVLA